MAENPLEYFVVKPATSAPLNDLAKIYKDAGWWEPTFEQDLSFLDRIVKNSAVFVGAFAKKKMIGMGRALSDSISDAYIQDVAVRKRYRGQGIGKKIIQRIIEELEKKGVDWIGLVAEPGTASFYNDLGFEVLSGHTPLKYRGKK